MGGEQLTLSLLIYTLLEIKGPIGKCPTAWSVVASLEGEDLGACLGLTVAAKATRGRQKYWHPSHVMADVYYATP